MRTLEECRKDLDEVDQEIVRLFEKRMEICREVAEYKFEHKRPILDRKREQAVLESRKAMAQDPQGAEEIRFLFEVIMDLCKDVQQFQIDRLEKPYRLEWADYRREQRRMVRNYILFRDQVEE